MSKLSENIGKFISVQYYTILSFLVNFSLVNPHLVILLEYGFLFLDTILLLLMPVLSTCRLWLLVFKLT